MLNEENMQRLLKSSEGKKPVAVPKQTTNSMTGYLPVQHGGPSSPKAASKFSGDLIPPISAGEPQRSLIKGRG